MKLPLATLSLDNHWPKRFCKRLANWAANTTPHSQKNGFGSSLTMVEMMLPILSPFVISQRTCSIWSSHSGVESVTTSTWEHTGASNGPFHTKVPVFFQTSFGMTLFFDTMFHCNASMFDYQRPKGTVPCMTAHTLHETKQRRSPVVKGGASGLWTKLRMHCSIAGEGAASEFQQERFMVGTLFDFLGWYMCLICCWTHIQ